MCVCVCVWGGGGGVVETPGTLISFPLSFCWSMVSANKRTKINTSVLSTLTAELLFISTLLLNVVLVNTVYQLIKTYGAMLLKRCTKFINSSIIQ